MNTQDCEYEQIDNPNEYVNQPDANQSGSIRSDIKTITTFGKISEHRNRIVKTVSVLTSDHLNLLNESIKSKVKNSASKLIDLKQSKKPVKSSISSKYHDLPIQVIQDGKPNFPKPRIEILSSVKLEKPINLLETCTSSANPKAILSISPKKLNEPVSSDQSSSIKDIFSEKILEKIAQQQEPLDVNRWQTNRKTCSMNNSNLFYQSSGDVEAMNETNKSTMLMLDSQTRIVKCIEIPNDKAVQIFRKTMAKSVPLKVYGRREINKEQTVNSEGTDISDVRTAEPAERPHVQALLSQEQVNMSGISPNRNIIQRLELPEHITSTLLSKKLVFKKKIKPKQQSSSHVIIEHADISINSTICEKESTTSYTPDLKKSPVFIESNSANQEFLLSTNERTAEHLIANSGDNIKDDNFPDHIDKIGSFTDNEHEINNVEITKNVVKSRKKKIVPNPILKQRSNNIMSIYPKVLSDSVEIPENTSPSEISHLIGKEEYITSLSNLFTNSIESKEINDNIPMKKNFTPPPTPTIYSTSPIEGSDLTETPSLLCPSVNTMPTKIEVQIGKEVDVLKKVTRRTRKVIPNRVQRNRSTISSAKQNTEIETLNLNQIEKIHSVDRNSTTIEPIRRDGSVNEAEFFGFSDEDLRSNDRTDLCKVKQYTSRKEIDVVVASSSTNKDLEGSLIDVNEPRDIIDICMQDHYKYPGYEKIIGTGKEEVRNQEISLNNSNKENRTVKEEYSNKVDVSKDDSLHLSTIELRDTSITNEEKEMLYQLLKRIGRDSLINEVKSLNETTSNICNSMDNGDNRPNEVLSDTAVPELIECEADLESECNSKIVGCTDVNQSDERDTESVQLEESHNETIATLENMDVTQILESPSTDRYEQIVEYEEQEDNPFQEDVKHITLIHSTADQKSNKTRNQRINSIVEEFILPSQPIDKRRKSKQSNENVEVVQPVASSPENKSRSKRSGKPKVSVEQPSTPESCNESTDGSNKRIRKKRRLNDYEPDKPKAGRKKSVNAPVGNESDQSMNSLDSEISSSVSTQTNLASNKRGRKTKFATRNVPISESSTKSEEAQENDSKLNIKLDRHGEEYYTDYTCGNCKKIISKEKWAGHMLFHYGLGWRVGIDNDIDLLDYGMVTYELIKYQKLHKIVAYKCSKCSHVKKSAAGYYSHFMICGLTNAQIEQIKVSCTNCDQKLLPSAFDYHVRTSCPHLKRLRDEERAERQKREAAERSADESLVLGVTNTGKPKRKSAAKASRVMANNVDDLPSNIEDFIKSISSIQPFVRKWQVDFTRFDNARCVKPTCKFITSNFDEMTKHFASCVLPNGIAYQCVLCKYGPLDKNVIINHIESAHDLNVNNKRKSNARRSRKDSGSGQDFGESSSDSDTPSGDEEDLHQTLNNGSKEKKPSHKYPKTFYDHTIDKQMLEKDAAVWKNHPIQNSMRATVQFRSLNYSTFPLFEFIKPNFSILLPVDGPSDYIPLRRQSLNFYCQSISPDVLWQRLNLFQSINDDNQIFMFCGGPVVAIEWIPIPDESTPNQYLIVCTKTNQSSLHSRHCTISEKCIIQVWKIGMVSNELYYFEPKLIYAIVSDNGPIFDVKCCPSGGYSDERLGIIAVPKCNGDIEIFGLPSNYDLGQLIRCKAAIQLDCLINKSLQYQVLKIAWSKAKGHGMIAAGYTNGFVCCWDLDVCDSPLLCSNTDNILHLTPIHVIQPSRDSISFLEFHQDNLTQTRWLAVGGIDRITKFFDLQNNHMNEVSACRHKSSITSGVWPTNWTCYINGHDEQLTFDCSAITVRQPLDFGLKPPTTINTFKGRPCDISFNDWLNVCVFISTSNIYLEKFGQLYFNLNDSRRKGRYIIGQVAKKVPDLIPHIEITQSDDDSIIVTDVDMPISSTMGSSRDPITIDGCNIQRINRILFNPNSQAYRLYACGLDAGFVHIKSLPSNIV